MEPKPASGTLIFLFTDLEGSTRLWGTVPSGHEGRPRVPRLHLAGRRRGLERRVRMGLHDGEAATRSSDYFGPVVNRTARIMAAGHGGARMSQLRAVVRLRRLQLDRAGGTAGAQLRADYDTFTEGFTTADLTEARALLETDP